MTINCFKYNSHNIDHMWKLNRLVDSDSSTEETPKKEGSNKTNFSSCKRGNH